MEKKLYTNCVVTGSVAYDEIMDFPGRFRDHFHPEHLHQINVSFVVDRLDKQFGGVATNIAYNFSLLSESSVGLLSAVGKDGRPILDFLNERKIDTSGIIVDETLYTSTGKVITDMKDNQIWGFYFGALSRSGDLDLANHITPDSLVIVSPTHAEGFLKTQAYCIKNSLKYAYDPGMALTWITDTDLAAGIEAAAYILGNDYEIAQIERRLKKRVADIVGLGGAVITTLGDRGARYEDRNGIIEVGPYKECTIVDPTGAGDAFRGGFFAGLVDGLPTEVCLKQANAIASFAVETYGTVNHRPSRDDVMNRVAKM